MYGNSGNSNSRVQSSKQTQLGPTIRNFHFSFMNLQVLSNNKQALNRSYKRNSTKVFFAIALIIFLVQFGGHKKHEIKIKSK